MTPHPDWEPNAATAESPRGSRRAIKRRQVLEAAKRLFLREGYSHTSMDDVSREAGVSKATVYAYFGTKEKLFGETVNAVRSETTATLDAGASRGASPAATLGAFGRAHAQLVLSQAAVGLLRVLFAESRRSPGLVRTFYRFGPAKVIEHLARYLESETRAGRLQVPDPILAAEQFIGMILWPAHIRTALGIEEPRDRDDFERRISEGVATFLARYGAKKDIPPQ